MQHKSVLVVGGAGYIGSHVSHGLINQGHKVTILDDLVYGQKPPPIKAKFIKGNCQNKDLVKRILNDENIDCVVHLASFIEVSQSVLNPQKFYSNNVFGTLNLLQTMLECNVKKIIFSSSCSVYGVPLGPLNEEHARDPNSPYGRTKCAIEWMIEDFACAYGIRYTIFRYFNAAGAMPEVGLGEQHEPETHLIPLLIKAMLKDKPVSIFGSDYETPDGTCVRDYVHVRDIAEAHNLAIQRAGSAHKNEVFNLGTGQGFSVRQIICALEELMGKKALVKEMPRRPGDPPMLVASAEKAERVLGWKPQYSLLKRILKDAIKWERLKNFISEQICHPRL
ncbi:UDP-glucose 4-epimerase GalE [Candidatus Dependentiae bacterium]